MTFNKTKCSKHSQKNLNHGTLKENEFSHPHQNHQTERDGSIY